MIELLAKNLRVDYNSVGKQKCPASLRGYDCLKAVQPLVYGQNLEIRFSRYAWWSLGGSSREYRENLKRLNAAKSRNFFALKRAHWMQRHVAVHFFYRLANFLRGNYTCAREVLHLETKKLFRGFWLLFKDYWSSEDKWKARGLLAVVIAMNFAIVCKLTSGTKFSTTRCKITRRKVSGRSSGNSARWRSFT